MNKLIGTRLTINRAELESLLPDAASKFPAIRAHSMNEDVTVRLTGEEFAQMRFDAGRVLRVDQAAYILGVSPARVRAMIKSGKLIAEKIGRDWTITPEAIKAVIDRKPGRPSKK